MYRIESLPTTASLPLRARTGRALALPALLLAAGLAFGLAACAAGPGESPATAQAEEPAPPSSENLATAIFAGGCFWCMEPPFDKLDGVVATTSGYTGGHVENPSYEQVSSGGTGHLESIRVTYDPAKVSYEKLLEVFWHNIDPTDGGGQFCDRGQQYTTAVFTQGEEQRKLAEASKAQLEASGRFDHPLATEIRDAGPFYPAEEYHQDFYEKNPIRYKTYRYGCGRDQRLEEVWGDMAGH
jgi:peptide-methionine (S)-S-oxide reductase